MAKKHVNYLILLVFSGALVCWSCGPAPARDPVETEDIFNPDHMIEVAIEIDPADWDEIRHQNRDFMEDILDPICAGEPARSPYTYFPGKVTVDGVAIEPVGVRKKCFAGSCDENRPALKIKFNEYLEGQRFHGLRRLTLNNCRQDFSSQ